MNDTASALAALNVFYNTTFPAQIDANGDQPLESSRTRPYHYRAYNLAALVVNAQIGDYLGLSPDPWTRRSSANTTLQDALHFAMAQDPAVSNETDSVTVVELNPLVVAVANRFGDPDGKYMAFLNSTDPAYFAQPYYALANNLGRSGYPATATANLTSSSSPSATASGKISGADATARTRPTAVFAAAFLAVIRVIIQLADTGAMGL